MEKIGYYIEMIFITPTFTYKINIYFVYNNRLYIANEFSYMTLIDPSRNI